MVGILLRGRCFISLEFSYEIAIKLFIKDLSSMLDHRGKYKLQVQLALSTPSWQPCVCKHSDCFEQGLTGFFGKGGQSCEKKPYSLFPLCWQ